MRGLGMTIPAALVAGAGIVAAVAAFGVRPTANLTQAGGTEMTVETQTQPATAPPKSNGARATATFANGCFWCTEAVFQQLKGVEKVVSGYMGGAMPNPTYEAVCTGATGHAECVQITFDPAVVSYAELLEVFFRTHDPTTKNRQGADVGTQYRSAIFYHDDAQKAAAETAVKRLDEVGAFPAPIVTEIAPASVFYSAEKYHQNYYNENPRQPYCQLTIPPKLEKLKKAFAPLLKKEE